FTIVPDYFAPLGVSLIGKAVQRGDSLIRLHDLREWTDDPHRSVDDTPFGGGPGMVMKPDPWGAAIDAVAGAQAPGGRGPSDVTLVVPSPSGVLFTQAMAAELAGAGTRAEAGAIAAVGAGTRRLIFACGRYEGIDER